MKNTNLALNFQLAQIRAILSSPGYIKGITSALLLSAGASSTYAHAAAGDGDLEITELTEAFKNGKGSITITGQTSDKGADGKFTNITINAPKDQRVGVNLHPAHKILINDTSHPYTSNYIKAEGDKSGITVANGVIEIGAKSSGAGTAPNPGLHVAATKGASINLFMSRLTVDSELHISTSDQDSRVTVSGVNTVIGNGTDAAKVVVGDISANNGNGSGSVTFGRANSSITVNKNSELQVVSNGNIKAPFPTPGTFVDANTLLVDGGTVHFKHGTKDGFTSVNSNKTDINDGHVRFDKDSDVTLRYGTFNVNGNTNVEIGGKLTLNNSQKLNIADSATFAASSGSNSSELIVYNDSNIKLSKAKLKEFLTGLKEDGAHVQYTDITESDPSKRIKEAGQASIDLNASIEIVGDSQVDLANDKELRFSDTKQAGAITSGYDGKVTAQNITVSKKVSGASKLSVASTNLSLGSESFDSRSSSLGVARLYAKNVEFVPQSGSNNYTLQDHLILSSDSGSIKGNVTVSGGRISINNGANYELEKGKNLVLEADRTATEAGSALSIDNGSLAVSGLVHATDKGSIAIKNGRLDASKATALKVSDNSIKLGENSAIVLNGDQVLNLDKPDQVTFYGDAFSEHAIVSSDESAVSTITMTNLGTMNIEQYRDLRQKTAYNGFFNGFEISGTDAKQEMDYAQIESGTPDSIYRDTQMTATGAVNNPISVGNVKISTGNALAIQEHSNTAGQATGNLVKLTNSSANGNSSQNFVQKADGSVAGVELSGKGAALQLQGTGNIGSIQANANDNGALYIGSPDSLDSAHVKVTGDIGAGASNRIGKIQLQANSNLDVSGKTVNVDNLQIQHGSELAANSATVTITSGSNIEGVLRANELKFESKPVTPVPPPNPPVPLPTISTVIAGNGTVEVQKLTANPETFIQVGEDTQEGLNGTLLAKNVELNKGTIFVDPNYNVEASYAVVDNLSGSKAPNDAGTLDGYAVVGKNAVLAVGFDNKDDVVSIIKNKLNSHGAFVEGADVQNALVLNKQVTLAGSDTIIINSQVTDPAQAVNTARTDGSAITFGNGSALVVTDKVYEATAPGAQKTGAAINIAGNNKNIKTDDGGVVILSGNFTEKDQGVQIFSGTGLKVTKTIQVQSANGLLAGSIDNTSDGKIKDLALNRERLRSMFKNSSKPVQDLLEDVLSGQNADLFDDRDQAGAQFVAKVATDSHSAAELDRAVHAASYAGVQQAAIDTSSAMTNAMMDRGDALNANRQGRRLKDIYTQAYYKAQAERKGNKIEVTTPSLAADSNTGIWATPTYVSTETDGYEAQNASYGADIDIKGVTVGADTLVGNVTLGVAASIGTGESDGNGQGTGLKDEFDYYGLGVYTAISFGQFSLIGDTSVTAIKHDISGASGINGFGNVSASPDSLAISAGITGKYKFETPYMDIAPHFGTRFLRLSTDSYDLYSSGAKSNLLNTHYDDQNIFSFPVGVSLSKLYHVNGWILNPDIDLTVTANVGDTDASSSTKLNGITTPLDLTTQVMDDVTYRAKVGFGITNGNFNSNINVHYTGSENTKSYGINANIGYDF